MPRPARTDTRVDVVIAVLCGVVSLAILILPAPVRERTASALRATLVAPLASMQAKAELSRRAFLAHDAAVRVADSVTLRSLRLMGVEQENAQLRELLGLGAAVKWGFVPAEALQGRSIGDDYTVTLSAGKRAGVEALSAVVAPEGLVGMVEHVDQSLSIAILWPHPDFRASAMAADGNTFGIVQAHLTQGAERSLLELRSVPLRSQLKVGALIVSSGLGGVFPRGIPIGTVIAELKTAETWARTYLVRPVARLSDVTSVLILSPARVRAGIESVWDIGAAADSAARHVGIAADSMVKLRGPAATPGMPSAKPPLDSVRPDSARRKP